MKSCHHCGRELQLAGEDRAHRRVPVLPLRPQVLPQLPRSTTPGANNQCREPQAEWQTDKDKANFCEFFEFREVSPLTQPGLGGAQSDGAPRPGRVRRAVRQEALGA